MEAKIFMRLCAIISGGIGTIAAIAMDNAGSIGEPEFNHLLGWAILGIGLAVVFTICANKNE